MHQQQKGQEPTYKTLSPARPCAQHVAWLIRFEPLRMPGALALPPWVRGNGPEGLGTLPQVTQQQSDRTGSPPRSGASTPLPSLQHGVPQGAGHVGRWDLSSVPRGPAAVGGAGHGRVPALRPGHLQTVQRCPCAPSSLRGRHQYKEKERNWSSPAELKCCPQRREIRFDEPLHSVCL